MVRVGGLTAGAIARSFEVSRPAVSRHLRVLREAGLVQDDVQGRERVYRLDPCALDELEQFLRSLRAPAAASHRKESA
jgi:DNA-binding transcriptional ArsR family regulator